MSDMATDLSNRDILARIDRNLAEVTKLNAEGRKLLAEADKFKRDRFLASILVAGALGAVVATLLPTVLRSWGVHV